MQETAFERYVKQELKALLADIESGVAPANGRLDRAVRGELMGQTEWQKKTA